MHAKAHLCSKKNATKKHAQNKFMQAYATMPDLIKKREWFTQASSANVDIQYHAYHITGTYFLSPMQGC